MKKRILGRTGLKVSVIGLGGIPLQRISAGKAKEVINKCHELGINFIDTARGYTVSEELIGNAIKDDRDKWIIATKSTARDYEGMKKDIQISLRNLQTDYIDLYQLHLVKNKETYDKIMADDGAFKALVEAKEDGKIGHIGITSHSADILEEVIETGKFETIQFPYNPVENLGERLFKRAKELNIGVIAMKPIAGGAIERGELSLKYILSNNNITTAIPGMCSIEEVEKNAQVGRSSFTLTGEEESEIKRIIDELGTEFCRRCGYCGPCPEGIDIPTQFIFEGYYTRYGLQDWAKKRYDSLDKRAEDCKKCGACEPKCPYNLPIRKMLERVAKNLGR
jgi:predicted aldo/keto reductase-like oxidoreductase